MSIKLKDKAIIDTDKLDGKDSTQFALASHGNHVPTTQAANNKKFLRCDNTWQDVTPANIGAAASSHTHSYLPLAGGTLTGKLTSTGAIDASAITTANKQLLNVASNTVYVGNPTVALNLESVNNPKVKVGSSAYTLYHTGNKPTLAEIGAAASSHGHNQITFQDTRSTNPAPKDTDVGIGYHLKNNSADGLNDGHTLHGVLNLKQWNDTTGGAFHQLGFTNNGNIYSRYSTSETAWSGWSKVYTTKSKPTPVEIGAPRMFSYAYAFGGNQNAINTSQFLTMLESLGAFREYYWIVRGSWSYAANNYINDTGLGNIHLAGSTVEVIGNSKNNCTIRIHTATTSGVTAAISADFIYVNNGDGYRPGWRKLSLIPTISTGNPSGGNHGDTWYQV